MDNTDRAIDGISSAGRIVSHADYSKAEEAILNLMPKCDMETVLSLCRFACNEHLDGVVFMTLTELLAIQLLKLSMQECLGDAEEFFRTTKDGTQFEFGNALATNMREKIINIKRAADEFGGYSDKGKNKMVKSTATQLNKLYSEIFEFYQMKYEFIIKDGTHS